jgi:hypothetical protein
LSGRAGRVGHGREARRAEQMREHMSERIGLSRSK